jgi:hypothetical protein
MSNRNTLLFGAAIGAVGQGRRLVTQRPHPGRLRGERDPLVEQFPAHQLLQRLAQRGHLALELVQFAARRPLRLAAQIGLQAQLVLPAGGDLAFQFVHVGPMQEPPAVDHAADRFEKLCPMRGIAAADVQQRNRCEGLRHIRPSLAQKVSEFACRAGIISCTRPPGASASLVGSRCTAPSAHRSRSTIHV